MIDASGPVASGAAAGGLEARMQRAAAEIEAQFLTVMLTQAGFGTPREAFGGGMGEAQFGSLLVEAHAAAIVRRGGIGLSEHLFNALKARAA